MIKLNLGAGDVPIEGFLSIDRKFGHEVYPLGYEDETVTEIRASHVLEHFPQKDVFNIVQHWVDKLEMGGKMRIAVPCFRKIAQAYLNRQPGESVDTAGYLLGGQTDENDYHKSMFDEGSLTQLMETAGLADIKTWESEIIDCAALPISLNLEGIKTGTRNVKVDCTKIFACMSMPRLAFTENMFTAMQTFMPLGVQFTKGTGVFWGQCLTRLIEDALKRGAELVFTLDYDTWFKKAHFLALVKLMYQYPEADAIIPVQLMRDKNTTLVGVRDGSKIVNEIPAEQMDEDLTRIVSGHFGLSVFRPSAFEKMTKPWFHSKPAPDGSWGLGRQDEDIAFWNNFVGAGCKAFMANKVNIGHMQMMCTFGGNKENDWKPIHVAMSEVEKGNVPAYVIPEV